MTRSAGLGALLAVGAVSLTVSAYYPTRGAVAQQPPEKIVTLDKIKDNLFVLKGGGGKRARSPKILSTVSTKESIIGRIVDR